MKKQYLIGMLPFLLLPCAVQAQPVQANVVAACGTPNSTYSSGQNKPLTQDTTGKLCDSSSGGGGGGAVTIADGADVTLGAKADARSTATDTTPITLMQVAKQISFSIQALVTSVGGTLTFLHATATPTVSASASVNSLVLKASATASGVQSFHAETTGSAAGFCVLYNGTSAPSTGALTAANVLAFQSFPANGWCDWTATSNAITASVGAVVLITSASTPFTYTTGTVTAAIYGVAQ